MRSLLLLFLTSLLSGEELSNVELYQFHLSISSVENQHVYFLDYVLPARVANDDPIIETISYVAFGTSKEKLELAVKSKLNGYIEETDASIITSACYTAIVPPKLFRHDIERIYYAVVSSLDARRILSEVESFKVTKPSEMRWAVMGDLGSYQSKHDLGISLPAMIDEYKNNKYDGILYIGDLAYEFTQKNGADFMRGLAPITASSAIQATIGNHEVINAKSPTYTLHNYMTRFGGLLHGAGQASNSISNLYYSFECDKIHFAVINTEVYGNEGWGYYSPGTFGSLPTWISASTEEMEAVAIEQAKWLESDLASVDNSRTPFTILLGHRPPFDTPTALELEGNKFAEQILPLLDRFQVDLILTGHEHEYMYFEKTKNASGTFTLPPIIVSGSPGNKELVRPRQQIHSGNLKEVLNIQQYGYGYLCQHENDLVWKWGSTATGSAAMPESTAWQEKHSLRFVAQDKVTNAEAVPIQNDFKKIDEIAAAWHIRQFDKQ